MGDFAHDSRNDRSTTPEHMEGRGLRISYYPDQPNTPTFKPNTPVHQHEIMADPIDSALYVSTSCSCADPANSSATSSAD
jgi:hypothetical protein